MLPSYISNLVSITSRVLFIPLDRFFIIFGPSQGAHAIYIRSSFILCLTLWNSLPANIQEITSLSIFKKKLKTHLFNLAYNE